MPLITVNLITYKPNLLPIHHPTQYDFVHSNFPNFRTVSIKQKRAISVISANIACNRLPYTILIPCSFHQLCYSKISFTFIFSLAYEGINVP